MGNAVVHFEVMAQDRKKLTSFYRDLFGWTVDTNNPMGYGVIAHSDNYAKGGVGIGGGIFGDMPPGQDGVTFYVEVDDIEATLQQAEKLGGTRVFGPEQVPGGPLFGHLHDPEGHWIGLFQRGYASSAAIAPDAARKGTPVVHFEVIGQDYTTLATFYESLFGWKPDADNPVGYGIVTRDGNVNADGIGIGGGLMALPAEMAAESNGHVTFYAEVDDVEATLQKAEQLGGKRLHGPDTVPGGGPTLGQFADPEGHLIGLTQAWS